MPDKGIYSGCADEFRLERQNRQPFPRHFLTRAALAKNDQGPDGRDGKQKLLVRNPSSPRNIKCRCNTERTGSSALQLIVVI